MTRKNNEITTLILTLLITLGFLGGGFRLFLSFQSNSEPTKTADKPSNVDRFAQVTAVPSGLFNYGGSTTWAPIRKEIDSAIQVVQPNFKLRYLQHPTLPPGSGTGIMMLLDNQLAFAQTSRALQDQEYQQAQQKGFTLQEITVAIDGIAVAVHPQLNLPGLTVNQLKDIYTGKITNWSQVGGEDLPIKPYSRALEAGGTIEFFVKNVMGNESFGSNVQLMGTTTEALRKVAQNPGGIYYASAPEVVPQCGVKPIPIGYEADTFIPPYQLPLISSENCPNQRNQLNLLAFQTGDYPLTRRLFVVIKKAGQADQEAGEAYANFLLTNQGQNLLQKTGFIRIR